MLFKIALRSPMIEIGIAIQTAIFTCLICTDINALRTAAIFSLILVFPYLQPIISDSLKTGFVNTASREHFEPAEVSCLCTRIYADAVSFCNFCQTFHKFRLPFARHGLNLQRLYIMLYISIPIKKANGTFLCIRRKPGGQHFKISAVIIQCIALTEKYRVVPPDHPFFSNLF